MRRPVAIAALAFCSLAGSAPAAEIVPAPQASYPSGTPTITLTAYSNGGAGQYGWVAYKLPTEPGWRRCLQGPTTITLSNLPDGTYTVLVADDLNENWLASHGLLNSGIAAKCETTDLPGMPPKVYTFIVSSPAAPQPPSRPVAPAAPPAPTPSGTPVPATPISPAAPPTTVEDSTAHCRDLKTRIRRARTIRDRAAKAYRRSPTKRRKKALTKARKNVMRLTNAYVSGC